MANITSFPTVYPSSIESKLQEEVENKVWFYPGGKEDAQMTLYSTQNKDLILFVKEKIKEYNIFYFETNLKGLWNYKFTIENDRICSGQNQYDSLDLFLETQGLEKMHGIFDPVHGIPRPLEFTNQPPPFPKPAARSYGAPIPHEIRAPSNQNTLLISSPSPFHTFPSVAFGR